MILNVMFKKTLLFVSILALPLLLCAEFASSEKRLLVVSDDVPKRKSIYEWAINRVRDLYNVSSIRLETVDASSGLENAVFGLLSKIYGSDNEETYDSQGVLLNTDMNPEISRVTSPVLGNISVVAVGAPSLAPVMRASLALMNKLSWEKTSVFTPLAEITEEFRELSSDDRFCLENVWTYDEERADAFKGFIEKSSLILAFVKNRESFSKMYFNNRAQWIIHSLEGMKNISNWTFPNATRPVYLVEKAYRENPEFPLVSLGETESPALSSLLEGLTRVVVEGLGEIPKGESFQASLKIRPEKPKFYYYRYHAMKWKKIGEFKTERIFLFPHLIEDKKPKSFSSFKLQCVNLEPISVSMTPSWRLETWLTSILTLACLGIVSCLVIGIFVALKSCSIMIEGSQYLSIFLLFCLILVYSSLFLFGLTPNETVCQSRNFAVGCVYTITFATLLGRSFMLATGDFEGLPGHVSGFVQSALIFFICAVEAGMIAQEVVLRTESYSAESIEGRLKMTKCRDNGFPFLRYVAYPALLLICQLIMSPFIAGSKRNYREGFLFILGSVAISMSWIIWITAYLFLPNSLGSHWYDITLCFGLISLPMIVLIVIFIPKLYLMSSPPYKTPPMDSLGVNLRRVNNNNLPAFSPANQEDDEDANSSYSSSSSQRLNPSAMRLQGMTTSHSTTDPGMGEYACNNSSIPDSVLHSQNPTTSTFVDHDVSSPKPNANYSMAASAAANKAATMFRNDGEYPTFKLDKNAVIDTRWRGYSFSNSQSKIPDPPPIPPPRNPENK